MISSFISIWYSYIKELFKKSDNYQYLNTSQSIEEVENKLRYYQHNQQEGK